MRLEEWLKKERGRQVTLARDIGVPVSTIQRIVKERRSPTHNIMEKIIRATGGEVLPNDFFDLPQVLGGE